MTNGAEIFVHYSPRQTYGKENFQISKGMFT